MRGFTMVDLLLVACLAGLFLSLGLPALRTIQGNIATTVEQHRLLSLLRTARTAASAGRRQTVLCPLASGAGDPACGAASGEGWLLFTDGDRDLSFRSDDDDLLRVERLARRGELHVLDGRGRIFAGAIAYRPDGSVRTPATLTLCSGGGTRTLHVVVSMTGRVRTAREEQPCA
ncbi:MAG: GspH/FimT family pseudopilin [Pseudohaliea sp.]